MPKASSSKAAKKPATKRNQMAEKIPLESVFIDSSQQKWKIGPSTTDIGFGKIYCAAKANESTMKNEDYPYFVKVAPRGKGPLSVEMNFYERNGKKADIDAFQKKQNLESLGMPHFVGHGSHDKKHRFIVMPRFGSDVWSLYQDNGKKMPLHTVYRLAIQMLDVYEYIHERKYVHADLKAINMRLGFGKDGGHQVFLVGFGLASLYATKDFKPVHKKMRNGTIEYTSRDAHKSVPTMRGDFEILAYNVIQWAGGELPWEKNKKPSKVRNSKQELMSNIDSKLKTCFPNQQCPEPISAFLEYVTELEYNERPDYEKCREIFLGGLNSLGKTNSGKLEFKVSDNCSAGATVPSPAKKLHSAEPELDSNVGKNQSNFRGEETQNCFYKHFLRIFDFLITLSIIACWETFRNASKFGKILLIFGYSTVVWFFITGFQFLISILVVLVLFFILIYSICKYYPKYRTEKDKYSELEAFDQYAVRPITMVHGEDPWIEIEVAGEFKKFVSNQDVFHDKIVYLSKRFDSKTTYVILSGSHGCPSGQNYEFKWGKIIRKSSLRLFSDYENDRKHFKDKGSENVKVIDIFSKTTDEISDYITGKCNVVFGFCFSRNDALFCRLRKLNMDFSYSKKSNDYNRNRPEQNTP